MSSSARWLLLPVLLAGCTAGPDERRDVAAQPIIAWPEVADCRDLPASLAAMLARGVLPNAAAAPLGVVQLATGGQGIDLQPDLPVPTGTVGAPPAADCLLVVMPDGGARSGRRVLGRSTVTSEYASGSRRQRNPRYVEAQRALEREEREEGGGRGPRLRSTGDTFLDLIALIGTGVITGVDALMQRGDRAEAQQRLAQVPEWIEEPEWRPYQLSLQEVEIARGTGLRLALLDTRSGQGWRKAQEVAETRLLRVADGLHQRDRNRAGPGDGQDGYVDPATARAIEQAPLPIKLSALLAALVPVTMAEAGQPLTLASLALEPRQPATRFAATPAPADETVEPAAGPRRPVARSSAAGRSSVVQIAGLNGDSTGFYLAPDKILALAKAVGGTSLVRVEASDGFVSWGVVQHEEPGSELVLLHVPRDGQPLPLATASVDLAALKGDGLAPGAPLLADGRVAAVAIEPGMLVGAAEIRLFLERARRQ